MNRAYPNAVPIRSYLAVGLTIIVAFSAGCGRERPLEPEAELASLPSVDIQQRLITASTDSFIAALHQIDKGNEVLITVKAANVPSLDRQELLRDPDAAHFIMLLPLSSQSGTVFRSWRSGYAPWSREDVNRILEVVEARGALEVQSLSSFPVISAKLPTEVNALRNMLGALRNHPNLDFVEPNRGSPAQPGS